MQCQNETIISNELLAPQTYRMVLTCHTCAEMVPGQFINIKLKEFSLRRPISICSIDGDRITIIYKTVGQGTKALSDMKAGECIDVFAPLGHGYPIESQRDRVLLIGGGVGIPPLYELAKQYRKLGKHVDVVCGFPNAEACFYEAEFTELGAHVYIATMDGSRGCKGTVLDAVRHYQLTTTFICACGPLPMLKALEAVYSDGYFSLESRMACGMGACMACVAKDQKEADMYHRICKEGPVFPIGKVVLA